MSSGGDKPAVPALTALKDVVLEKIRVAQTSL
jgi:hypothetical protein